MISYFNFNYLTIIEKLKIKVLKNVSNFLERPN